MTKPLRTKPKRHRIYSVGIDGIATLLLSLTVATLTGGISVLVCFGKVFIAAKRAAIPPEPASYCLVLGVCLHNNGTLPKDFTLRLQRARQVSCNGYIIIGGTTNPAVNQSEAQAGADWLVQHGVAPENITLEDRSRNTLENLREVRQSGIPVQPNPVIVTNRYHLSRTRLIAEGLGMHLVYCPAEERFSMSPTQLARMVAEALFIHWYYIGRVFATRLKLSGMLDRIR